MTSLPGEQQDVDLAELAARALADCAAEAAERGIAVSADLGPAAVLGDPVLLRQLLLNLLHNAIRHNHDGGFLTLATGTESGAATLRGGQQRARAGCATLAQLSEPFRRGAGRTAGSGGHGLGLSIVAAIAERHHGTLEMSARKEGGLEVTVRFPAAGAAA